MTNLGIPGEEVLFNMNMEKSDDLMGRYIVERLMNTLAV